MTARSTLSSTHHHHDITPTGTLREWVAAINPQAKDSWYVYPLVNVFSPFGEARDQAWAIKTSFTQNRFQWKFLGRDVLASPNDPPGPAFAQLTAFDILEAIDSLDLKKTRAYWCKVAINFFLLGLFAFLLIFLSPFMVSSLVDNFDPKTFPVSICLILGYGITGLCFLLHYKTRFFRTKIYISATKLEQLRLSILQYESSKTWRPRVKAIFKRIKEAEGLSSIVSLKDLVDVIFCQQKFISGLAKDLAEAEDLNNESVKELASMGTTIGQLRDRIKSLEHSLEEKASSLQKSQEELKEIRDSLSKEVSSLNSSMVKLQSELAASSVLYSHIQEENRKLADRLQTLTSSNFLMEAERERLNQELKEKENEKIDLSSVEQRKPQNALYLSHLDQKN